MPTVRFSRTRLAPTPSGFLHLGNAASFLLTANLARKHGAKILLRIDDLDRERVRPEYVQDIFDTLHWLDIPWDEGPRDAGELEKNFSQVHRKGLYDAALQILKDKGLLFACTCSRTQLAAEGTSGYPGTCRHRNIPLDTPGASLRLRTPDHVEVIMRDLEKGEMKVALPSSMRDLIVRKKDGVSAYQLSSVVDDLYHGVDLIVRGADLFHSTLAQLFLSAQLDDDRFGKCTFHHHPLMVGSDGLKLSKSAGSFSIRAMKAAGKSKEEVIATIHGLGLA